VGASRGEEKEKGRRLGFWGKSYFLSEGGGEEWAAPSPGSSCGQYQEEGSVFRRNFEGKERTGKGKKYNSTKKTLNGERKMPWGSRMKTMWFLRI